MFEFNCVWCDDVFTSTDVFIAHIKCDHKYNDKLCPVCHQPYTQFYRLKKHMKKYIEDNPKLREIEGNKERSPQKASTSSADVMEVSGQGNLPTEDFKSLLQKCLHDFTVDLSQKFSQEDVKFILGSFKKHLLKPMLDYIKNMLRIYEECQEFLQAFEQIDLDEIIPTPPTQ